MKPEEYLNKNEKGGQSSKEQLLIIENRIASILGELSTIDQKDSKYLVLDQEFNELLKQKRNFNN